MLLSEGRDRLSQLEERIAALGRHLDVAGLTARAAELDLVSSGEDLWQNAERAQAVLRERSSVQAKLAGFARLQEGAEEVRLYLDMAAEGESDALAEAEPRLEQLAAETAKLEFERMLGGEHDRSNAIVTIHPGAGGLEAQDWAEMLMRMVLRWAERRGYKAQMVDELPGEGAGIKSATFTVEGEHAYGYLKAEAGVHRLVRISPFDANARRQTSFAAILVSPEIEEDIDIEIRDEDLRVDTYRSSGAGGQHVNKTDSAVRLTHLPTGIVVACQNERSQHKNRAMAMKILRSRLYELELEKQREKKEQLTGQKREINFGSQIRSYVLHPYRMVKDHRTGIEIGNADAVLDGDLDRLIEGELLRRAGEPVAAAPASQPA
ncbi:MAG TPA: peptide chain release factor 2 [Candidatus Binatia bacterium]|nr:peptide chain release factor 2 [Candidatus Binatia bacterium]